jgi:hypothetical protein
MSELLLGGIIGLVLGFGIAIEGVERYNKKNKEKWEREYLQSLVSADEQPSPSLVETGNGQSQV